MLPNEKVDVNTTECKTPPFETHAVSFRVNEEKLDLSAAAEFLSKIAENKTTYAQCRYLFQMEPLSVLLQYEKMVRGYIRDAEQKAGMTICDLEIIRKKMSMDKSSFDFVVALYTVLAALGDVIYEKKIEQKQRDYVATLLAFDTIFQWDTVYTEDV